MIEFRHVQKVLNRRSVLEDISFKVGGGETVFIIGRSGIGKSVLLKLLMGLMKPTSGEIYFDSLNVHKLDSNSLNNIRKKMSLVFQQPALLDSLSVRENLKIVQKNTDTSSLKHVLGLVQLGEELLDKKVWELSLGIQKRVSIARALMNKPQFLLFDEPTTGQDPHIMRSLMHLIQSIGKDLHCSTLVVSHDIHRVVEVASRILLLKGKLIFDGTVDEFMSCGDEEVQSWATEAKKRLRLENL